MQKAWKENYLVYIVLIILIGLMIPAMISTRKSITYVNSEEFLNSIRQKYIDAGRTPPEREKYANEPSFFAYLSSLLGEGYVYTFITNAVIMYIIISIISVWYAIKFFKSNYVYMNLTRERFKDLKQMIFKKAYKPFIILPIIALIMIIYSLICSNFNFSYSSMSAWKEIITNHYILFILFYLLNIIVTSGLFVNINIIVMRKQHNFIAAIIISFLVYIAIELFFEVVLTVLIFQKIFHNYNTLLLFNIFNYFPYSCDEDIPVYLPFLVNLLWYTISWIIIKIIYHNKEKFILDCTIKEEV